MKYKAYLILFFSTAGDPAVLHRLVIEGELDMDNLQTLSHEELIKFCEACGISKSKKSKVCI